MLSGPAGCGKSVTLFQTAEYCAANGWFVIYVPRAIDWVNSTKPFAFDAASQSFMQHTLAQDLLKQIAAFNSEALASLSVPTEITFARTTVAKDAPLRELVAVGCNDPNVATSVLRQTLDILGKQDKVPVLLAVDDFQALYRPSSYRDPQYRHIQALHLSMPRLILEYASGQASFARGAIVGAVSQTNREFPVPVELQDALGQTPLNKASTTWMRRNAEYARAAEGLRPIDVPAQLNAQEAGALVEVWAQSGSLHSDLNDSLFLAKLAETGGNAREFIRRGYLSSLVAW